MRLGLKTQVAVQFLVARMTFSTNSSYLLILKTTLILKYLRREPANPTFFKDPDNFLKIFDAILTVVWCFGFDGSNLNSMLSLSWSSVHSTV